MHLQLEILKEGYIYILRKALISYCNQLLWKTGAYDKDSPSWPNSCWGPGSAPSSRSVCAMCSIAQLCPTLATSWTVALQAPLSMGFSRQEYWSGLPFPSPGDLPNPGMELAYSALGGGILYHWTSGKPLGWGELNSKNTHSSDKPADWWVSLKKGCNHVLPPPAFICQGRNHNVDTH